MAGKTKYYVVWQGHKPGIYTSWDEAQKQVSGFKDAKFKSFNSKTEAEQAYKDPSSVKSSPKEKKPMYYVVWRGSSPGIYTNWGEAQKAIAGVSGPIFKTFGSKELAEQAFNDHPDNYKEGSFKKTRDLTVTEKAKIGKPIELSLCVDAACNNKGDFEYKGVWTFNQEEDVFLVGPYKNGSNNIGEFLALVHALAYLNGHKDEKMKTMPIYSDSRIAMGWVRAGHCRTKKQPGRDVLDLIARAEKWLNTHTFKNPILKWETKAWGEIPADFGRK